MPSSPSPSIESQIGARIRALRSERAVTLEQLAVEVSLTKGQLSRIENGKVSVPVSTLTRIAAALGVSPGTLFQNSDSTPRVRLVRKADRRLIVGRGTKLGHFYESLAYDMPFEKDFEPYLMTIEEKQINPAQNVFKHPGHELLFMLEGKMDYRHAGETYHLEPGDSLFFDGAVEHGPVRVWNVPVRFLSVIGNVRG